MSIYLYYTIVAPYTIVTFVCAEESVILLESIFQEILLIESISKLFGSNLSTEFIHTI